MPPARGARRAATRAAVAVMVALVAAGCTAGAAGGSGVAGPTGAVPSAALGPAPSAPSMTSSSASAPAPGRDVIPGDATAPATAPDRDDGAGPELATGTDTAPATVTLAFAGDVHFAERTADLLAEGPATALREAADQLSGADLTMVNLETAITERGSPAPKQFHFRAPASALDALAAGGVDAVSLANNHAVDYGDEGLADTLAVIETSPIPVLGIGADADRAYAPHLATVSGVRIALLAASQVHDWTIAAHTAEAGAPGIASAFSPRLVEAVRTAREAADVVVVYLHWGIEFASCPSPEQRALADALAEAGATAVVGTHAHVLQGAGWRDDGVYVAYGLGNYYWWRSFGNLQDDNGVLTLTVTDGAVTGAEFVPTRLDERGVPQVVTGAAFTRAKALFEDYRACADLRATPPLP